MPQRFHFTVSVRRFQFTLRGLLVAILVVGSFLGGFVWGRASLMNKGLFYWGPFENGMRSLVPLE
jgi:hypothetical protein